MFRIKNLPAHFLTAITPGHRFRPKAEYGRVAEQVLVLNRSGSSSIEIYIRPRLLNSRLPITYVDFPDCQPGPEYFTKNTFVIISRYINYRWYMALKRNRDKLAGVAYLMDDNIPEAGFDHTLPPVYALGLAHFFYKYWKRLQGICSELWVSSPNLFERYHSPVTHRLDPLFISKSRKENTANGYTTIFYHAQRPHYQDNLWLRDVVNHIQHHYEHTVFETFGGDKVKQAYTNIPRSRVLSRFNWEGYLDYCSCLNYDIGLAPINSGIFNQARSINKLFDISRCGGAGIYTDTEPYSTVIDSWKTGVLCEHNKEAWIEAISELIENESLRKSIYNNCVDFCENHNKQAATPDSLKALM